MMTEAAQTLITRWRNADERAGQVGVAEADRLQIRARGRAVAAVEEGAALVAGGE